MLIDVRWVLLLGLVVGFVRFLFWVTRDFQRPLNADVAPQAATIPAKPVASLSEMAMGLRAVRNEAWKTGDRGSIMITTLLLMELDQRMEEEAKKKREQ